MKKMKLALAILGVLGTNIALAGGSELQVSKAAPYYDEDMIESKIISECDQLGAQFSQSTAQYLRKRGYSVSLVGDQEMAENGDSLKLTISNAVSSGNAFVGHRKSVSIIAELYKDGQLVDKYKHSRDSGGGFMGGFKSSCAVLARCANTLGSDVAKWVSKKQK